MDAPRLRPRSEDAANATKVTLAELTPDRDRFLGQAAYLQLTLFENISALVSDAPTIEAKEALSRAVAISLDRYQRLSAEIRRTGDPAAVMAPYTAGIDFFQGVTKGATWYEGLVTSHITAGILDDFFALLAVGLPGAEAARVKEIYAADSHEALLAELIRLGIAADPTLSSRLAMWGRRLVGDTMLVARSALAAEAASAPDESRIEPVFTELIAAHTRRMDALGLTA